MSDLSLQPQPRKPARGKKLLYHLQKLSAKELDEFAVWLHSPLHGNSAQFAAFLQLLLQELGKGADAVPADRFHALIPAHAQALASNSSEAKARDKYLGVRLSKMMVELRRFMTWKQLEGSPHLSETLFLEALCDRNCDKYLPQKPFVTAGKERLDLATRLRGQLDRQTSLVQHVVAKGFTNQPLAPVHQSLDDLFLLEKVKYACAGQLRELPASDPLQSPLLAAALLELERRAQAGELEPVAAAYLLAFRMQQQFQQGGDFGAAFFQRFKSTFKLNSSWASKDAMDLFVHGHNHCILQFQRGKTAYIEEVRQLYDEVLAAGHPLEGGILPYQFYKNAVEVMCKLQNYQWAEAFTERFRERLAPEHAPQLYAYNKAILSFFREDYPAVVSGLYQEIRRLAPLQIGMGARVYLCRALWKTNQQSWLVQQLQAFEQHLRRKRDLQEGERKRYQGFIRYLGRASQAVTGSPNRRAAKLAAVVQDIEEQESLLLYRWLRQELAAEIEKSSSGTAC